MYITDASRNPGHNGPAESAPLPLAHAETESVPIRPYLKEGAFGPETVTAMGTAFEDVCQKLENAGRSDLSRETIATKIIELARGGEADPVVLREMALMEFGLSGLSKS
jgi:hypothetical protein